MKEDARVSEKVFSGCAEYAAQCLFIISSFHIQFRKQAF